MVRAVLDADLPEIPETGTGTVLLVKNDPVPNSPPSLLPQHFTVPLAITAQA
jgi:hypothetical protein